MGSSKLFIGSVEESMVQSKCYFVKLQVSQTTWERKVVTSTRLKNWALGTPVPKIGHCLSAPIGCFLRPLGGPGFAILPQMKHVQ